MREEVQEVLQPGPVLGYPLAGARSNWMKANITQERMHGCIADSSVFQKPKVQPGMRLRRETPPESRQRNGMNGRISAMRHSGNSRSNCARSR